MSFKKRKFSKATKVESIQNLISLQQKISDTELNKNSEAQLKTNLKIKRKKDAVGASTPPPAKKGKQKN